MSQTHPSARRGPRNRGILQQQITEYLSSSHEIPEREEEIGKLQVACTSVIEDPVLRFTSLKRPREIAPLGRRRSPRD